MLCSRGVEVFKAAVCLHPRLWPAGKGLLGRGTPRRRGAHGHEQGKDERASALKDEGTHFYQDPIKQTFAFADSPIVVSSVKNDPVVLYAYAGKKEEAVAPPPATTARER